jgi:hypothetical protein
MIYGLYYVAEPALHTNTDYGALAKHILPVTVSFIYILEPIMGAFVANIYLHELLPIQGYAGGMLVVAGAIIHCWGTSLNKRPSKEQSSGAFEEEASASRASQAFVGFVPSWDIQSHRQVGTVPYSLSRKGEKTLVQRRRRNRLQRLGYQEIITWSEVWSSGDTFAHYAFIDLAIQPIEATEMRSR